MLQSVEPAELVDDGSGPGALATAGELEGAGMVEAAEPPGPADATTTSEAAEAPAGVEAASAIVMLLSPRTAASARAVVRTRRWTGAGRSVRTDVRVRAPPR